MSYNGWVSTKDRLPKIGETVLVWNFLKKEVQIDTWNEQFEAPVSFSSQMVPIGPGWDENPDFEAVTHWQPMIPPGPDADQSHPHDPSGLDGVVDKIEAKLSSVADEMRGFAGDFQDDSEEQDRINGWADIISHPNSRVSNLLRELKANGGGE